MSGHSKWHNIKQKKGKEDAKRGRIFTKLGKYIMVAVKEGGPDPDYNPQLKVAIDKAKAENMPNDNIERAIKKGAGEDSADSFEEITYEGYGPSGIAVLVNCLTDNRNRTAPDVRHAFDKYGGNLGTPGSVSFMFDKKGQIVVLSDGIDGDELMMVAIDAGAEDVIEAEDAYEVITAVEDYHKVRQALEESGYEFVQSDITYIPQNYTTLTDPDDIKNMEKMIDVLEDNDDVQEVYTNWDRPEED
ncbi:DNA-binding regulatory protein, YebC/PmpR family [Peptoniphilus asaccharolyticus DSM 20463]|uniref:Probable transcriptional regulatory protein SAMN00017477_0368 n=1 Tax=Peptoniphilus asaccharolyticus DSM 20463 TaxID=573058 RepID=A0A1W1ULC5_PEPAS|nr:YebC/PmpR family DNA-binding transcriptional regulator [Peptoniphilus asaccharolyticus]MBL7574845.1 YebC/PmpR family DNA-binding transcriptional regulator [Peptoniphilus asaccharolyticus]SMB81544.1 DNA-binding regulatory protein, YebC/PmpR family [Peptoniphilus asaccharolyticus DSM 20463]